MRGSRHPRDFAHNACTAARGAAHGTDVTRGEPGRQTQAQRLRGLAPGAVAILRDPVRFYDPGAYARAVDTVDAALRVISAVHHPLRVDFTAYRTPFALTTPEEIAHDEGDLCLAIIEHEAARVQFVVNARRRKWDEAADDHRAELGRDVARRRASTECVSRKRGVSEEKQGEED